jgi:transposase
MFSFTGWRIEEISFSVDVVQVNLLRDRRRRLRCPACGRKVVGSHEQIRTARDMPLGPATHTLIIYPAVRARCGCGWASWLGPPEIDTRRKATYRMLRQAVRLARDLPLRKAAELLGIGATRLRNWDKAMLAEHLQRPDLDAVRFLLVDEKAIGRGHDYITTVLNAETGELLHSHEGRRKASLKAFFDTLSDKQKANIQAVCVDRSGAYVECVREQLPNADICYDRFHLVKNFNDIVDKVRREEWNRARREKDERTATLIKGQRYNLLRRGEKNSARQQSRLEELLAMNKPLSKTYLLLEDFRQALGEKYVGHAERAMKLWVDTALQSGIDKVKTFARRMRDASNEIINAIRHGLNNGRLEGFNNLIARILHRGCGYGDNDYFFLKLRQAALPAELQVPMFQK